MENRNSNNTGTAAFNFLDNLTNSSLNNYLQDVGQEQAGQNSMIQSRIDLNSNQNLQILNYTKINTQPINPTFNPISLVINQPRHSLNFNINQENTFGVQKNKGDNFCPELSDEEEEENLNLNKN